MEPRAISTTHTLESSLPALPSTPLPSKLGRFSMLGAQTCPPKNYVSDWDIERNPYLKKNLALARQRSMQFRPKYASPLSKASLITNDD